MAVSHRSSLAPLRSSRGLASKVGLAPGTAVFIGERRRDTCRIDLMDFSVDQLQEAQGVAVADCAGLSETSTVSWIQVNGVHDIALIEELAHCFGLHPMTVEDIVNTSQRPKCEFFPHYCFVAMKMLECSSGKPSVRSEHVSLIFGTNFVISFLEDEGDVFDSVRERIRRCLGRVRSMPADYLVFCLMDAVIDHYFLAIERIGDALEAFDARMLIDPRPGDIQEIHSFKAQAMKLRKAVWPLRDVIATLASGDSSLQSPETTLFWRDLHDHAVQVIDSVETRRDVLASLHDSYLSSLSYRMNEVMKVLTIISTIFIPLTFIVGVYGMNFKYMPELEWRPGYFVVWGVMVTIALSLFGYFRRRRWI
jgi:magnesium transporter